MRFIILAMLVLGLWAGEAQAKCYPDASGGAQTCEVIPVPGVGGTGGTSAKVTPTASGTIAIITTGGTPVALATGPINGGYVLNPLNAASQGVTAENAYVDPVGTPGSTDSAGNGTTAILQPGQPFYLPPLATGAVVKGNANTSGHKLTVVTW